MKKSKALIKTLRKSLDKNLKPIADAHKKAPRPVGGWVQAVREALGMTTSQLAERMGIHQSGVMALQDRELQKTVTLESLERAARAMNCELVYAIVPKDSLEKILDDQCLLHAQEVISKTVHTMELEQQPVSKPEMELHLKELAREFKQKMNSNIWKTKG